MPRTRLAFIVCLLAGCHDDSRDPSSPETEPMLGTCIESCPVGGPEVCAEGTVCVDTFGGGVCGLACEKDDPEACVVEGILFGRCVAMEPDETWACLGQYGPVCIAE